MEYSLDPAAIRTLGLMIYVLWRRERNKPEALAAANAH